MTMNLNPLLGLLVFIACCLTQPVLAQTPKASPPVKFHSNKAPAFMARPELELHPADDQAGHLRKRRHNAALQLAKCSYNRLELECCATTIEQTATVLERYVASALPLLSDSQAEANLLSEVLELYRRIEWIVQARVNSGKIPSTCAHQATYWRTNAELRLVEWQASETPSS